MNETPNQGPHRFRAVAFDLLTALMDSWSLWIDPPPLKWSALWYGF